MSSGTLDKSAYAASLGGLLHHDEAGRQYWDKKEFDKLTYTTEDLGTALEDIRERLQHGVGNGFRHIVSNFGGGKTHAMIAMYHKCKEWDVMPVVIDGIDLDPSTDTIWGEIQRQLDGTTSSGKVAPGGDVIAKLLDRPKPVLILIDEIGHYLDGSKGVSGGASNVGVGESNMAAQTVNFMQKLFSKTGQLPHVCVVISLPDRTQVVEKQYYDMIKDIAGRQQEIITVARDVDIPHIIRRRLFQTDDNIISDRASGVTQSYVDECVAGRSISQSDAKAYMDRFKNTYPFTPDVLDVLYGKWGSYHSFQRTRGALRLLSSVVHSLLQSDRPYITLSDIDLNVDAIREELVSHVGTNIKSVITTDITGESGAGQLGDVGVRVARAIFMYSFPIKDKGATRSDIKRAAFTATDDQAFVNDTIDQLHRRLFFLDLADETMFRFTHDENINRILDRATNNISDTDADAEERRILQERAGTKFRRVYVWPDRTTRIDDIAGLQLIIMEKADVQYCKQVVTNVSASSGRINQNALVFVLPTIDGVLTESIRKILAIRTIRKKMELKQSDKTALNKMEGGAKGGILEGIRKKYVDVYIPSKDDIIRPCRIANYHPNEDQTPFGDVIWKKLVDEYQIAERLDPELVVSKYDGEAEDVFNRMMRTCGERRPASLDVILDAMVKPVDVSDPDDTTVIVDYPPKPIDEPDPPPPVPKNFHLFLAYTVPI